MCTGNSNTGGVRLATGDVAAGSVSRVRRGLVLPRRPSQQGSARRAGLRCERCGRPPLPLHVRLVTVALVEGVRVPEDGLSGTCVAD